MILFQYRPSKGGGTYRRSITGKIPLCVTVVTQRDLVGRPEPQNWDESQTLLIKKGKKLYEEKVY